jgi:hypothetical protein
MVWTTQTAKRWELSRESGREKLPAKMAKALFLTYLIILLRISRQSLEEARVE